MQRRTQDGLDAPDGPHADMAALPLVIDAASTVSTASLLILALLAYIKPSARRLFEVLGWLLEGRDHMERQLAAAGCTAQIGLPLDPQLAGYAASAAARGRSVHLALVRRSPLLEAAASREPFLGDVIVGPLPEACEHATRRGQAIEMHRPGTPGGSREVMRIGTPSRARELAKGLRLHQCVKNLIVFVPVVLGGHLTDPVQVGNALLAFLALSLVASGTYLVNDVWDLPDDRHHWTKRFRPIASGRLSVATALVAAPILIAAGIALSALVSLQTVAMLLVYLAVTLAYTLYFKTVPYADGLVLATLFSIRLGIGAVAANVPPSPWLFVFSMFLFTSLSYAKRHTEIARAIARQDTAIGGRGYQTLDAPMVLTVGLATGIAAVMIMVLYIVEEAFRYSFYGSTVWLWGFPPLVFLFIMRVWLVSTRGEMHDDPVAFAITDRPCLALLALFLVCFGFAWLS